MTRPLAVAGSHLALLRETTSKHAVEGLLIGCAAVLLATAGTNYLQKGNRDATGAIELRCDSGFIYQRAPVRRRFDQ